MNTQSDSYIKAKDRFNVLSKAISNFKQLDTEIQDFIISEIDRYYIELTKKGMELIISEQSYTKTTNNKEKDVNELHLLFSLKPSENIRNILKKIGFKYNHYNRSWFIEKDNLLANEKHLLFLKQLDTCIKDKTMDLIPNYNDFFNPTIEPEPEPESKPEPTNKIMRNPNLCYICQKNPNKVTGNYPTRTGKLQELETCLSCTITNTNYIIQD